MKLSSLLLVVVLPALASGVWAAPLTPADAKLEGMKLTVVPAGQTVEVAPLPVVHFKADGVLKVEEPGWRGSMLLPRTAWTFKALKAGSLVVTLADRPEVKLVEGTDYVVDYGWGSVAAREGSQYPAGTKLHFEYDYTESRIDLFERTPDGKIVLTKGKEDRYEPLLPAGTPGNTPLLSVYLPPNTAALTMENVNLIDPKATGVPPVSGTEYVKNVRDKLRAGKPVTIVFLGDSITAQEPRDFSDGLGSYVDRFTAYVKAKYPASKVVVTPNDTVVPPAEKQIVIVKAGVGGDDTPRALQRLGTSVIAHKPDAVVVMLGVNDENRRGDGNSVPVPQYKANMEEIVGRCKATGADVIVMTTSMKNLGWIATVGNLNEYAAAAREVARDKQACLVDSFKAWEDIPKTGYNYMVFLGTCINHPVDLGHNLFFLGLKAAFEQ
jgi:lysophospholipase L1-like esterase